MIELFIQIRIMVVILNFFEFLHCFDDVGLPLWIHIFVGIFICASALWAFLVLYGFVHFVRGSVINEISSSKSSARIEALKKSLGITASTLSIDADGTDETSHTYTHISMRKPCEHNEKFEIRSQKSQ